MLWRAKGGGGLSHVATSQVVHSHGTPQVALRRAAAPRRPLRHRPLRRAATRSGADPHPGGGPGLRPGHLGLAWGGGLRGSTAQVPTRTALVPRAHTVALLRTGLPWPGRGVDLGV